MKKVSKTVTGIALAAGMLMSTVALVLPPSMSSMVVYAGENDFSWKNYEKKDSSWWKSSEAIGIADEIVKYQLSDGGWRKDMKTSTSGSWNKSTIDNNATWGQIYYLAKTAELYTQIYNSGGAAATAELYCYTDDTRTAIDNTHLSIKGSTMIADMIADGTKSLDLKVSEKLK